MAAITIPQLPNASAADGSESFPIWQGGQMREMTLAQLLAYVQGSAPSPQPSIAISSAQSNPEGNTGTTAFNYTVTLTRNGSTASLPFTWSVAGSGSNPANAADFGGTFPSGSGTFAAGETSKTIQILASGDTAVEPDEAFTLTVTLTGYNTVTAQGTIINDDSAVTFSQPYNPRMVFMGDSRTAQGGNSQPLQNGLQRSITTSASGIDGWLPTYSDERLMVSQLPYNNGIGGSSVEQIFSVPRQDNTGTVTTGSASMGLDKIAAAEPAIVVLWAGTNNSSTSSIDDGGSARVAYTKAIDYLTNPSSTAFPGYSGLLYQGKPKTVIIINEMPKGTNLSGAAQNNLAASDAARFKAYADWLLKFSYDSGDALANPHVIVADVFNDPTILDVSTGGLYRNLPGLLFDGLHPTPAGAARVAKVLGTKVKAALDSTVPSIWAGPTSATVGNFLNPNPLFTTQSGGASTITPTSGAVPAGYRLLGNTLAVAISYEADPDGQGSTLVLKVSGTITNPEGLQVDQIVNPSGLNYGTDKFRLFASVDLSGIAVGSTLRQVSLALAIRAQDGNQSYDRQIDAGAGNFNGNLWYKQTANGTPPDRLKMATPLIDTAGNTSTPDANNACQPQLWLVWDAGTVNDTIKISRFGVKKVTA